MLEFEIKAKSDENEYPALEPGIYTVKLENLDEKPGTMSGPNGEPPEPWLLWKFVIMDGEDEGRFVWTTSSLKTGEYQGKKAKARRFMEALLSRDLEPEDRVKGAELIGLQAMATVTKGADKKGNIRNNIEALSPIRRKGLSAVPSNGVANPKPTPTPPPAPTEKLFEGADETAQEELRLSLPRRHKAALDAWVAKNAEHSEVDWTGTILGEDAAGTKFTRLTVEEQTALVEELEGYVSGDKLPF